MWSEMIGVAGWIVFIAIGCPAICAAVLATAVMVLNGVAWVFGLAMNWLDERSGFDE